ncbi:hypothetical protein B0H14DRAFT_3106272 [Mycena olivaceomarginata]|nr:hypothetical protein B0H14DRAFT_3106272 [Mycena olivaceomarginata]
MFLPFFSTRGGILMRRRGGGSGGASSSSSGGKGGSSSTGSGKGGLSSSSSKGGASTPIKTSPISSGGSTKFVSTYGDGGRKVITIPAGQIFAGRGAQLSAGRMYGSGYPGYYTRGVSDRPFPFYFWPIASSAAYMHSDEYGQPDNSSRPGGPMAPAVFQSNSTGTTFRLVADNSTVADLMPDITANCSHFLVPTSISPEQVVQYYRASSVALSLDGYNNSAVFAPENSTADTPLPSSVDTNLLDCLNGTIGLAVPLVDSARWTMSAPSLGVITLVLLLLGLF